MTIDTSSAESRLDRLIDRLLRAGETALEMGDSEQARSMADDVLTVRDADGATLVTYIAG